MLIASVQAVGGSHGNTCQYKLLAVPMVTVYLHGSAEGSSVSLVGFWSNVVSEFYLSVYSERRVCHCYGDKCIEMTKLDLLVFY